MHIKYRISSVKRIYNCKKCLINPKYPMFIISQVLLVMYENSEIKIANIDIRKKLLIKTLILQTKICDSNRQILL